jgi:hypothetical protein
MNIFFSEQGEGIPIILIHGFCETHEILGYHGMDVSFPLTCRVWKKSDSA